MNSNNLGSESKRHSRLWEGRMSASASEIFSAYVDSIDFDIVLAPYDVAVSRAHVKMLANEEIIEKDIAQRILDAFDVIEHEIRSGEFEATLAPTDEDVHTAIERRLTELTGDAGRALHTGRSRNDLSQMSCRLYVRDSIDQMYKLTQNLILALAQSASRNIELIMPGKTHLQHAQPILISHWLMSHVERLESDLSRLSDLRKRVNICVLGSGALAGSTLPLNAEFVSNELGCDSFVENSIFGVSTRDYIAEYLYVCSQIMVNLSCIGEDVVWMSSTECGYAILDDQFSSGSSMMPQKKNPDIAELARGKTGLTIGSLMAVLAATKSQIFGYNHDLQVDKEALFSAARDCELSLIAIEGMMSTIKFDKEACNDSLRNQPLLLATDITEEMVKKGTPFRISYKATAVCIRRALEQKLSGEDLCDYLRKDDLIGAAAREVFGEKGSDLIDAMTRSVSKRQTHGGTSTIRVQKAIDDVLNS